MKNGNDDYSEGREGSTLDNDPSEGSFIRVRHLDLLASLGLAGRSNAALFPPRAQAFRRSQQSLRALEEITFAAVRPTL